MNASSPPTTKRHLPAEEGLWIFLGGDLLVFSLFFLLLMDYHSRDLAVFIESQSTLNKHYGAFNTLALLTSSWFVALALRCARNDWLQQAAQLLLAAIACGIAFALVKIIEYSEKLTAGFTVTTNEFYTYYYMFTGVHFFHLLVGMAILSILWRKTRAIENESRQFTAKEIGFFEGSALYWHMVDLLWIVLFTLIYLVK